MAASEETLSAETAEQSPNIWSGGAASDKQSKVNRICDAFLTVLSGRIDTNLQNLVTAHVCKSPPDLDSGLELVATLRGMWIPIHRPSYGRQVLTPYAEQNPEQAEEAVEHMCFLTDAHRLFDNALGLYDLELTLMVAQQAQRVRTFTTKSVYKMLTANRIHENIFLSFKSYRAYPTSDVNLKSTII